MPWSFARTNKEKSGEALKGNEVMKWQNFMEDMTPAETISLWRRKKKKIGYQLLKGNMWSAILVALLCMIEFIIMKMQGCDPEGDKVLQSKGKL